MEQEFEEIFGQMDNSPGALLQIWRIGVLLSDGRHAPGIPSNIEMQQVFLTSVAHPIHMNTIE